MVHTYSSMWSTLAHLTTIVIIAISSDTISAYPDRAGTCGPAKAISTSSGIHGSSGSGILENTNLVLKIDDANMETYAELDLETAKAYKVTLTGSSSDAPQKFKGFLFRLSSQNDSNDASKLLEVMDEDNSQILDICADDVAGICHTNKDLKSRNNKKWD